MEPDIHLKQISNAEVEVEEIVGGAVKSTVIDLVSKMSLGDIDDKQRKSF